MIKRVLWLTLFWIWFCFLSLVYGFARVPWIWPAVGGLNVIQKVLAMVLLVQRGRWCFSGWAWSGSWLLLVSSWYLICIHGGGGAFQDGHSWVLGCFLCPFGIKFAYMVELETMIRALDFVREKGWSLISLECDSLNVVTLISSGPLQVHWFCWARWNACLRCFNSSINFQVTYFLRRKSGGGLSF